MLAERQKWMYYYFSGFDTPYRKQVENDLDTVEAHFGLFSSAAKLNKAYEKLVINGTTGADGAVEVLPLPTSVPSPAPSKSDAAARTHAHTTVLVTLGAVVVAAFAHAL